MRHVVMFSGGLGSWAAARRVADQHGTRNLTLLFADVKGTNPSPHAGEDQDTYRFLNDAATNIGAPLIRLTEGRDIWQVFKDDRFLGNTRLANCSKILKQQPARAWLDTNRDPTDTTIYVGIDWTETHRLPAIQAAYHPYAAAAPLTEAPYLDKPAIRAWAENQGLRVPRLYDAGFPHNNCGGGCVRAGAAQFALLLRENRDRYLYWETREQELRDHLGKPVAILRDRTHHTTRPLTLREFRDGIENQGQLFDPNDFGGCGCFLPDETSVTT